MKKLSLIACGIVSLQLAGCLAITMDPSTPQNTLPHGPDTCKSGYVWREAVGGDRVCVTPAARAQAYKDNMAAASRRSPTGGAYGPDTCKQGYVWREARSGDHVCVTPGVRQQTQNDNALAAQRRVAP